MAPQLLEKIESAPGNGMVSEASNPQHLVRGRAADRLPLRLTSRNVGAQSRRPSAIRRSPEIRKSTRGTRTPPLTVIARSPCDEAIQGHDMRAASDLDGRTAAPDRGREGFCTSPPSEPYGRFSRIRLSSRWFPHRDCLACRQAASRVNSSAVAKNLFGQQTYQTPPLTPLPVPTACGPSRRSLSPATSPGLLRLV
jgi:hypothetical protein